MPDERTHYETLGVTPQAPQAVIAAVYRAWMKAMRVHPDLGGDEELAKAINAAYAVVGDPRERRQYDRTLAAEGALAKQQRRAPRTPVDVPIALCIDGDAQWNEARALDASVLGLRLRLSQPLAVGRHVSIAFPKRAVPAVEAIVRWSTQRGQGCEAGVEFFEPAPQILRWLRPQ